MTNKIDNNPCARRNIPLDQFKPLFELPFEFHVLQKDIRPEDQPILENLSQLHCHQDELKDFADTAAIIQEMDLVISVCTSAAHLAGALGHQSWVLLPYSADYRWMLNDKESPWYPSIKLIRSEKLEIGLMLLFKPHCNSKQYFQFNKPVVVRLSLLFLN